MRGRGAGGRRARGGARNPAPARVGRPPGEVGKLHINFFFTNSPACSAGALPMSRSSSEAMASMAIRPRAQQRRKSVPRCAHLFEQRAQLKLRPPAAAAGVLRRRRRRLQPARGGARSGSHVVGGRSPGGHLPAGRSEREPQAHVLRPRSAGGGRPISALTTPLPTLRPPTEQAPLPSCNPLAPRFTLPQCMCCAPASRKIT